MTDGLLDSSILIDYFRGNANAAVFLSSLAVRETLTTHVMVAAELLAGARNQREQVVIESFLSWLQITSPTESDGLAALDFYRRYHLSSGVDWPDCLIAATAERMGIAVYTQNVKHFAVFPGLRVVRGY
jgi:predicted nucleic acid-binding protein